MALTCIGKGENARGSDFQRAKGGFVFAFGKQNEIENSGGAHEQSSTQRRLLIRSNAVGFPVDIIMPFLFASRGVATKKRSARNRDHQS